MMDEKQKYTLSTIIALAIASTLIVFGLAIMQYSKTAEEKIVPSIMLVLGTIIVIVEYIMFKILLLKRR